jgi:hypothetical protein
MTHAKPCRGANRMLPLTCQFDAEWQCGSINPCGSWCEAGTGKAAHRPAEPLVGTCHVPYPCTVEHRAASVRCETLRPVFHRPSPFPALLLLLLLLPPPSRDSLVDTISEHPFMTRSSNRFSSAVSTRYPWSRAAMPTMPAAPRPPPSHPHPLPHAPARHRILCQLCVRRLQRSSSSYAGSAFGRRARPRDVSADL